jgi:membrane associated rhomboid family serine protease
MNRALVAWLAIGVGVALALVSVLGDVIGIGSQEGTFGWKQIAGLVVGVVLIAAGIAMRRPARPAS